MYLFRIESRYIKVYNGGKIEFAFFYFNFVIFWVWSALNNFHMFICRNVFCLFVYLCQPFPYVNMLAICSCLFVKTIFILFVPPLSIRVFVSTHW